MVGLLWTIAGFPKEHMVYALIHDFPEAYIGDLPSPIKYMNDEIAKAFKNIEYYLDEKIYDYLGIPAPSVDIKRMVKICDNAALIIEGMTVAAPGSNNIESWKRSITDPAVWELVDKAMPTLEKVSKAMRGNYE